MGNTLKELSFYEYQAETIVELFEKKRSLAALDMGLGKTYVALGLIHLWKWKKLVIVCPKSKLRKESETDDSWENMLQQYVDTDFKLPKVFTTEWIEEHPLVVINYDMLSRVKFPPDTTYIFDEIQYIKNSTSNRGKSAFKMSKDARQLIGLSGNPLPNGMKDGFNLMQIFKGHAINYKWFQHHFFEIYDNGVYPEIIGTKNEEEFWNFFHENAVWLKTEDVLELPKQVFIPVEYKSPKEFYDVLNYKVVTINDETFAAKLPITKLMMLRELSSGVLKDSLTEEWHYLKSDKLFKLNDILESTDDNLIIFYNFVGEKDLLLAAFGSFYPIYEINGQKNEKEKFMQSHQKSILLAQYQSASSAIDGLQKKSHHLVCFSPTLSANHWSQMLKRIHRIGQENTCYYYLFQNKIEKKIYKALKNYEDYTILMFEKEFWNG